jgi:hypothetical protein
LIGPDYFCLGGLSTISDLDGKIVAQLDDRKEGVIVAEVTLDGSRKINTRPAGHGSYGGGFVTPHPFLFEGICYVDAFIGRMYYNLSAERRRKASAVSASGQVR